MLKWMHEWLLRPEIDDPLDRRHALTIQLLLLFISIVIPVSWTLRLLGGDAPRLSMMTSLLMAGWSLLCLLVLRRGRFRQSVAMFLGAFHLLLLIGYAGDGLQSKLASQILHSIGLLLAALLVGRRTLWICLLIIGLAITLGVWADLRAGREQIWVAVPRVVFSFLVIAVVLDRFATASREMLQRERRRAEELAQTHQQLECEMHRRERLQLALGEAERAQNAELITAGLAHELNNVLAQVYARLDGVQQSLGPSAHPQLDDLRGTIDQASSRIARILELVRRDEEPRQRLQPELLLRELEPRLRAGLSPSVQLQLELGEVGQLEIVATDLAQMVLALFNNAAAAIGSAGRIVIRIESEPMEQRQGCLISVSDDGCGMAPDRLAAVGQTLFTSPQNTATATSSGLGLVTCRALAERYGGKLRLRSTPGIGTSAQVWLPYAYDSSSAAVEVEVDANAVLLVDDDRDVCNLLALVLGKAGFRVDVADSVAAARQAQRSYGRRPPLLVMDRNLPDGDGVSLLEEFGAHSRGLLAVFSSVQTLREHERERLSQIRLVELAKPYAPDRMVAALKELRAAAV